MSNNPLGVRAGSLLANNDKREHLTRSITVTRVDQEYAYYQSGIGRETKIKLSRIFSGTEKRKSQGYTLVG